MGIYILHMPLVMKAVSVLVALSGSDNAVLNVVLITIGSTLIAAVITKLMMRTKAGRLMLGYAMDNNGSSSYWALSEQAVK